MAIALPMQRVAAQFVYTSHDARSGSMGGVFILDTSRQVEVAYRQDFMLAGMADKRVAAVWSMGRMGTAMAEYNHHGDNTYHEQQAAFGYIIKAADGLRLGVRGRWMNLGVADSWYEPQHWLGADVIAMALLSYCTELTVVVGTRPWDDVKPWRAMGQVAYRPSSVWMVVAAVESDNRWRMRCGMEYAYENLLFFRAGIATNPMLLCFGVGVKHEMLALDIGAEMHSALGLSPCCSIKLCF